ncbi:MAG: hypothetical protein KGZ68_12460 [Dechloromonas sp.]|nr:hypothetical protein [Dechloromonas sp.]
MATMPKENPAHRHATIALIAILISVVATIWLTTRPASEVKFPSAEQISAVASLVAAVGGLWALKFLRDTLNANLRSAEASRLANEIALSQMRARLFLDITNFKFRNPDPRLYLTITNEGETTATECELHIHYRVDNSSAEICGGFNTYAKIDKISSKETVTHIVELMMYIDDVRINQLDNIDIESDLIVAEISYSDVFGSRHLERSVWRVFTKPVRGRTVWRQHRDADLTLKSFDT